MLHVHCSVQLATGYFSTMTFLFKLVHCTRVEQLRDFSICVNKQQNNFYSFETFKLLVSLKSPGIKSDQYSTAIIGIEANF